MSQVISIFSTKGGVGRTFIATNLAVAISQKLKTEKVLLFDTDLQLPGNMAMLLNLKPDRSLVNLIYDWQKGTYVPSLLKDFIFHCPKANVDLLPAILSAEERFQVDDKFISCVLNDLSKEYKYIITDSGRTFNKTLISVFERTNLILSVVNPDILSVYQAKEDMKILQSFYFPFKMMRVVLNRAESLGGVGWKEVRAALPCDIISRIPSEGRLVGSALNRGIPLVLDDSHCRASQALIKLAEDLIEHPDFFISRQELETILTGFPLTKEKEFLKDDQLPLQSTSPVGTRGQVEKKPTREEKIDELKERVHKRIIQALDLRRLDSVAGDPEKLQDLRHKTMKAINNALIDEAGTIISLREEREMLVKEITDEVLGLGPLEDLINDPTITDIMVNNRNQIYVERQGKLELVSKRFVSNEQVRKVIERIIAPLGRRVDESVPMVDARLPDGSRINAIIPPLALTGPTLTVRKFGVERLNIDDLQRLNALDKTMADFLKACVLMRKNIIVSGGTGSGKTTALNVLSEFIPQGERIITIEDAAELKLRHNHWIRLESRPPNIEGKGAVSVHDLFVNSLRMRPDRIIIGECRGAETLDMLQAMNTGHDGSMTTVHANSTQDVLARLDSLILISGIEIPLRAVREMIASTINLIVHTSRLSDGTRRIMQITEVIGMLDELHIGLKDIFIFQQAGIDEDGKIRGLFTPTGVLPTFLEEFRKHGIDFSEEIFKQKE